MEDKASLIGITLYQIYIKGRYKNMEGKTHYSSKNIFLTKPEQSDIDEFIVKCCDNKYPNDFYDLDRETIKIKIHELKIK